MVILTRVIIMNKKNPNPLELMLAKMVELMEAIQSHKGPMKEISPELAKEFEELEKGLITMNEPAQAHLAEVSIDPKTIRIDTILSGISDKDKRVFERATKIKRDAKMLKNELDRAIKKRREKVETVKNKPKTVATKEQIKERRKRFKPIGADKKWIPL